MKIKKITKVGRSRVINLTVHKNHTFITKNGIVTHNCDHITKDSQAAFRGFIDEYSSNCTFIFTGNYQSKIIQPLIDRLENYEFSNFNKGEIVKQLVPHIEKILKNENIEYSLQDIGSIIKTFYPRIRSMVGALQQFSKSGKLVLGNVDNTDSILKLLNTQSYEQLFLDVQKLSDPNSLYSILFKEIIDIFKKNTPQAIVIIAKYQSYSENVRDKHLNLMACITELMPLVYK